MHFKAASVASDDEIAILRRLVEENGEQRVADAIGVSRATLGRYIGKLRVYRGTRLLFIRYLEERAAA